MDGAQDKEKRARDNVQALKKEITNLTRLVDQGAGVSIGHENIVNSLMKDKEDLARDLEVKTKIITNNQNKINEQTAR